MSDNNPIEALFQLQRDTIKQTEDIAEGILEVPTEVGETLSEGLEVQQAVQEQTIELSRQSIHRSLDATGSVTPENSQIDELRELVDDTFDRLQEEQAEAFDAVEEGYDTLSEDAVDNLTRQIELLIEVNESVEKQVSETVEQLSEQADTDELTGQLESQLTDLTAQFEEQVQQFSELEGQLDSDEAT